MKLQEFETIYLKLNLKRVNFFEIQLKKNLKKSYLATNLEDIKFYQDQAKKLRRQIKNLILEIK